MDCYVCNSLLIKRSLVGAENHEKALEAAERL